MKKIASILLCSLTIIIGLVSCDEPEEEALVPLTANPTSLDFDYHGGVKTIALTSGIDPTVSCPAKWCKVEKSAFADNALTLTVTVDENSGTADLTTQIRIIGEKQSLMLDVHQGVSEVQFTLSTDQAEFSGVGGIREVSILSSMQPEVALDNSCDWCTVERSDIDESRATIMRVFAAVNLSGAARTATATVTCGEETKSFTISQSAFTAPSTATAAAVTPETFAATLGMGWNLGNHMDSHSNGYSSETAWGNKKCTQATFDAVRAAGFTTVRIPITWMGQMGNGPEYKVKDAWMDRVEEIVGYAEKAGLNCIINIHHDGADSNYWLNIKQAAASDANNRKIRAQFAQLWYQIAERFKEKGDFLIFEPFNEVHDGGWGWSDDFKNNPTQQTTILNGWCQLFTDVVRATGGKNATRWLASPGYTANPDFTMKYMSIPTDYVSVNRQIAVCHFYDPNEFTLECTKGEWGHTAAKDKKASWGDEDNVVSVFSRLHDTFVAKGIPVYVGECGCSGRDDARERLFQKYYMEYVFKAAHDYNLPLVVWDNGATSSGKESHGYFDHATGAIIGNASEIIAIMKKATFDNSASYTLQNVYDNAPE